MSAPGRWIRLQVGWSDSEWIEPLDALAQFAWVKLMEHVKANGVRGRCKALSARVAGNKWKIPAKQVQAMLDAAHADGALNGGPGEWCITNWDAYQPMDASNAERQARHRARRNGA